MRKLEEFALKAERTERWLTEHGLDGIVLSRSDNFAWLGCGASNVVNNAQESGVGALAVEPARVTLIANNIEMQRLLTEELSGLELASTEEFPWQEPARRTTVIERLCRGKRFAADGDSAGLPGLPDGFSRLRYALTEAEIERYRAAAQAASLAMEKAAKAVEKGMTESDAAALVAAECLKQGLFPVVLLVAADDRIRNWRHPTVKETPARHYVMIVTCARRYGLIVALTRLVHFGEPPHDLKRRHHAVCAVDSAILNATVPGKAASEVFAEVQKAYRNAGYADEWRFHHQGGAIGYQPREYIATPECRETVQVNQAFAWNPSIRGTKSEDTMLVREDGFELLTAPSPDWPVVETEIEGKVIRRPDILVK